MFRGHGYPHLPPIYKSLGILSKAEVVREEDREGWILSSVVTSSRMEEYRVALELQLIVLALLSKKKRSENHPRYPTQQRS